MRKRNRSLIQAGQKLSFLRDLLKFRTRKFWQLGHDFIETGSKETASLHQSQILRGKGSLPSAGM